MSAHIPAVVMALATQVSGVPLAWTIYPDRVVIVMEDGRKMAFEREQADEVAEAIEEPAVLPEPPQQPAEKSKKRKEK